ncbi:MAG: flagellar hook-length control protein FliK [Myxococcota bacterium]
MKVDVLQFLGGKPPAGKKGAKPQPGFDVALEQKLATARPEKEEKKLRPAAPTTADELLLVARAAMPASRPAPLIDTKSANLKVAATKVEPAKVEAGNVVAQQLSARAHGKSEQQRVTNPLDEKKGARAAEPKREREPKLEPTDEKKQPEALLSPGAQPAPVAMAEPFKLEAVAPLKDAQPLAPVAPLMLDDASVRAVLLPTVARVSLDTGEAGRLNVQLKVQDGVTEIRATGPAAQLLESRQGELRVELAREGLALGHFDLSQHQHSSQTERPELELSTPTARRTSSASASEPSTATDPGRVHVKA